MAHLLSRNIFIDTSTVIQRNFGFHLGVFLALKELASKGEVKVYLTDITAKEIESNIRSHIKTAFEHLKKFQKTGMVLRNIQKKEIAGIFDKNINPEELAAEMTQTFKKYIEETKVTILETGAVNNKEIFERYFDMKPPFGNLEDKKYEFPDAFVLTTLKDWAEKNKQHIYVVSNDKGFEKYCESTEKMTYLDKVEIFLDLITTENKHHEYLQKLLDEHREEIIEEIKRKFEGGMGFSLQDQEGEVEDVNVSAIKIYEFLITKIEADSAYVSLPDIEIEYTAYLSYDNLDTAIYDSEEKVLIPFERVDKTVRIIQNFSIDIVVDYEYEEKDCFEIEKVSFDLDYDTINVYEETAETIEVYPDNDEDEDRR